MRDLIVSVPDHSLSFYFVVHKRQGTKSGRAARSNKILFLCAYAQSSIALFI